MQPLPFPGLCAWLKCSILISVFFRLRWTWKLPSTRNCSKVRNPVSASRSTDLQKSPLSPAVASSARGPSTMSRMWVRSRLNTPARERSSSKTLKRVPRPSKWPTGKTILFRLYGQMKTNSMSYRLMEHWSTCTTYSLNITNIITNLLNLPTSEYLSNWYV